MSADDFVAHLTRQAAFSIGTFGPGTRMYGVIDHIKKELEEAKKAENPTARAGEWVDVAILALDGLLRELMFGNATRLDSRDAAVEAVRLIKAKQSRNEKREWPDWRAAPADKAIEHVKEAEKKPELNEKNLEAAIKEAYRSGDVSPSNPAAKAAAGVDPLRGTGRTTAQMMLAPKGAIYIIPGNASYYNQMARRLNRGDLTITLAVGCPNSLRGCSKPVVVDHSVRVTRDLIEAASQSNWQWALGQSDLKVVFV